MPTAYRRIAEVRRNRRFHVVAGRPISAPLGNPWGDAANQERERAAEFADRVVLAVCCVLFGVFVVPDLIAWAIGAAPVMVAR